MNIDLIYRRLKEEEDRITNEIGSDTWKKDSDLRDLTFQASTILKKFIKQCSKEFGLSKEDEKALLNIIITKNAYDELDQETKIKCCISTIEDILENKNDLKEVLNNNDKNMIITMICSINHISVAGIARYIALGSMTVKDSKEVLKEVRHYKRDITNRLRDYIVLLEKQYGNDWVIKINKEEEKKYINIYCKVYDISRDNAYKELNNKQKLFKNKNLKNEANKILNLEALNQYRIYLEKKYGDKWNNLMSDKERKDYISLYTKVYSISKDKLNENISKKSNNDFEELNKFRIMLEDKYKDNWLGNMTKKEKDIFIDLYSKAYNIDTLKVREGFNKPKKNRNINELSDYIDNLFNKYGNDWASLLNDGEKKQFIVVYANTYKVSKNQAEIIVMNIFNNQSENGKSYEAYIDSLQNKINDKLLDLSLHFNNLSNTNKEEFNYLTNELIRINSIPLIDDNDIQKKYREMRKLHKEVSRFYEYVNNNSKIR